MKLKAIVLAIMATTGANAEVITPETGVGSSCGPAIKKEEVMLIDLEPLKGDLQVQKAFAVKHAGDYTLTAKVAEWIKPSVWTWPSRKNGIKHALKLAAKRGCNLVLILDAGVDSSSGGPTITRIWGTGDSAFATTSGGSNSWSYAWVSMGVRK